MPGHALDNPFFAALSTLHRAQALCHGDVRRYPADVAPFLGVGHADVPARDMRKALAALVPQGDAVLLLGVAPRHVPRGWQVAPLETLEQMTCTQALDVVDGPEVVALDARHHADLLALTARVYPHYFRPRTMHLGRYFGMYVDGRLTAIIGERLGAPGWREMSAICTDPDYLGRGYARRLTAWLTNDTLRRGDVPFLHVSPANARASGLYGAMGYAVRARLPFWSLRRCRQIVTPPSQSDAP